MNQSVESSESRTSRHLGVGAFIGLVVVYLVILQGLPWLTGIGLDQEYGEFPDSETLLRTLTAATAVALVFLVVVISWLGWWPRVLHDELRVQRWVWIVPIGFFGAALVVTDYANLADVGIGLTLALALSALLVGTGEELMFRGIGVETFRRAGMTETRVALWSSVVFGAAHITNIITEGPSAIVQVLIVSFSGYLFYLIRRVSGGLLIPILAHAAWDFSLFSAHVGADPDVYPLSFVGLLVEVTLLIIVFVRRHKIEPESEATPAATA